MNREEIIEILKRHRARHFSDFGWDKSTLYALDMAIKALEQEPKWIPVSERLPEWGIECLVVDDKGEFGVGFYRDDARAWDSPIWGWLEREDKVDNQDAYYMPCGIGKVIAWMPLPKLYEPQESEEK